MNKKPVLIFSAADINNYPYAVTMLTSLTKFHKATDIDIVLFTNEKRPELLRMLPKGVMVKDITPYLEDPLFWYRQKPILAEPFMDDYELVLGLDADQIIVGDLSYIFDTKDYDIGTVVNWNRSDPQRFGFVSGWGIQPPEYFNCGLVAMRNKKFVHDWKVLCFSNQFDRMQYKEQDLLNAQIYFGNWNVRNFDAGDGVKKMSAWWGLISKGEYTRAELRGDEIVIPKGEGDTPFPPADMTLKVLHAGGGNTPNKMNYRTWFMNERIITRIDDLVAREK